MSYINTVAKPLSMVMDVRRRIVGRKVLLTLSDKQLSDIGMTRMQAIEEARKPFWK